MNFLHLLLCISLHIFVRLYFLFYVQHTRFIQPIVHLPISAHYTVTPEDIKYSPTNRITLFKQAKNLLLKS